MSTGLLFVTAPEADHKAINLLLLHLRDWQYGGGDIFRLATTRNAYDYDVPPTRLPSGRKYNGETSPPLDSSLDNTWAGAAIEDVEGFCLDLQRSFEHSENNPGLDATLYVVVDSEGLKAHECVLGSRASIYHEDTRQLEWIDNFRKMRVPWDELYLTWCNLNIANMGWEDFAQEDHDEEIGRHSSPDDCWYTYTSASGGPDLDEKSQKRREDEIQRLRDAGQI